MKIEGPFNQYLGRILAKSDNPEAVLEEKMQELKERTRELDQVRQKMASGYHQVLKALAEAFPDIDLNDPNLKDSHNAHQKSS